MIILKLNLMRIKKLKLMNCFSHKLPINICNKGLKSVNTIFDRR